MLQISELADLKIRFQDKDPLLVSTHYRRWFQEIENILKSIK
jgi:hypothetical protein